MRKLSFFSSVFFALLVFAPIANSAGPTVNGFILTQTEDGILLRPCKAKGIVSSASDCVDLKGPSNLVPIEALRGALFAQYMIVPTDKAKPLSAEKELALKKNRPEHLAIALGQAAEFDLKLGMIEQLVLSQRGANGLPTVEKEQLKKWLSRIKAELPIFRRFGSATNRLNRMLSNRLNNIVASPFWYVSEQIESDRGLYKILLDFDPTRPECGLTNNVNENLLDCGKTKENVRQTSSGAKWKLASRKRDPQTGRFAEVWLDQVSGLLWADRIERTFSYYDAVAFGRGADSSPCLSDVGRITFAGLDSIEFELPAKNDLDAAEANGIREALPETEHEKIWTKTSRSLISDPAMHFFGYYGTFHTYLDVRYASYRVRCVSRVSEVAK